MYMVACTWTSKPKWSSHIDGSVHGQDSTSQNLEKRNHTQGCSSVGASFVVHGRMYLDIGAEVVEFSDAVQVICTSPDPTKSCKLFSVKQLHFSWKLFMKVCRGKERCSACFNALP